MRPWDPKSTSDYLGAHGTYLESQWLMIMGYFKTKNGLLRGIVAYYFQLLGCPGSNYNY